MRRHDLTKKSDSVFSESIFSKNVFLKVYFCKLYPAKVVRVCMSKAHANLLPNSQISHKLEYILNVTHLQQISISFVKSNPSWLRSFLVSNGPLAMVCFDLKYQGQYKFFERWPSFPVPRYRGIGILKGTVLKQEWVEWLHWKRRGLFRVEKVGGSFIFSSMGLQKCLTTVFSQNKLWFMFDWHS